MATELDRSALGVRYLLGELTELEEQSFEKSYFADDRLFEDLQITETEVIDAYVANEIDAGPRKHFEKRLAASSRLQERVAFARAFAESAAGRSLPREKTIAPNENKDPWWRRLIPIPFAAARTPAWALAASLIIILGAIAVVVQSVRLRNESQHLAAERAELARQREELRRLTVAEGDRIASELRDAQLRAQRAEELLKALQQQPPDEKSTGTTFASITLTPGSLRSGGDSAELKLPRGVAEVRLTLALPAVDYGTYRSYRVTITSPGGDEIQSRVVRPTRGNKPIRLLVPATRLPPGTYTVRVTGVSSSTGDVDAVSNYTFRVPQE